VPTLFVAAVTVALLGFLFYWGTSDAAVSIAGLFVLGFGISLFYPLVSGQAIGATLVAQHDRASARTALAGGVAILTMPGLLGELAGRVGLHNAHLLVPTLIVAMLAAFLVGRELERRRPFAHLDQ
jgi:fucose permease